MADRVSSTRRPEVVIRPEDLERYYTGKVVDAAGYPIMNDVADLNGYLQPDILGRIFYYDKDGNILPLEWRTQIDQYLIINDNEKSTTDRIYNIDLRMDAITVFAQKLIEFGNVVSKGSASFKATINSITLVFTLINKAYGAFVKVFYTALSWKQTRNDAELLKKITVAVKRLNSEAEALVNGRATLAAKLAVELPETAKNFAEYQSTNTLNNPEGTRNASTGNTNTVLIIGGIAAALYYIKKYKS